MLGAARTSEILTPHFVRLDVRDDDEKTSLIIDVNSANALCEEVDRTLGESSELYKMVFGSPLTRYLNIFLWPETSPGSLYVLYRCNTVMLLQYIRRSSLEWTVHYASARQYEDSLSKVAEYLAACMNVAQLSGEFEPPHSRDATSGILLFDDSDTSMLQADVIAPPLQDNNAIDFSDFFDLFDVPHPVEGSDVKMSDRPEIAPVQQALHVPSSPTIGFPTPSNMQEEIPGWDEIEQLEVLMPTLEFANVEVPAAYEEPRNSIPPVNEVDGEAILRASTPNLFAAYTPQAAQPITIQSPTSSRSRSFAFPVSEFARNKQLSKRNVEQAQYILNRFKVLAIAQDCRAVARGRRFSLEGEKAAIMSMPLDTSLSIGSRREERLSVSEMLGRAFARYDSDPNGNPVTSQNASYRLPSGRSCSTERIERALLMLAVALLRHKCMYVEPRRNSEEGKRIPGQHYALDFDRHLPQSSMSGKAVIPAGVRRPSHGNALTRRARTLCRIVVACGHPCIVVVLVRLTNRLGVRLVNLLDELPIEAFCNWLSTGGVTSSHLTVTPRQLACGTVSKGERIEADLKWLHTNVLLPLLAVSAKRMPDSFAMLDGRVECSANSCLAAIVPHALQTKFLDFLEGQYRDDQWTTGRVPLFIATPPTPEPLIHSSVHSNVSTPCTVIEDDAENDPMADQSPGTPQYSVATQHRTFARYKVTTFANKGDLFDPPPTFLTNRLLTLADDM